MIIIVTPKNVMGLAKNLMFSHGFSLVLLPGITTSTILAIVYKIRYKIAD